MPSDVDDERGTPMEESRPAAGPVEDGVLAEAFGDLVEAEPVRPEGAAEVPRVTRCPDPGRLPPTRRESQN
jgi:hypothetical protein